jgi:acyl-CoA synthetase (AMP-forming)/AMP-acid ligase II
MYPGAFVATQPQHPAVIMADSGHATTFAELDAAANRLSLALRSAGLLPGDHAAFCLENHSRYLEILWGCRYAGTVYTACSSRLHGAELSYILSDSGAKAFITSAALTEQARHVLTSNSEIQVLLMLDGTIAGYASYEETVAAQAADPLENRIVGADMLYSSGTTGRPKGVRRDFAHQPLSAELTPSVRIAQQAYGLGQDTVYLSPAPLYHAAPLHYCTMVTGMGGTAIVMDKFDPEAFLAAIERYRVTHTQVVPTMFVRLLKLDPGIRARYDLSSLRCVIHAAAPCPVPVKRQMIEWLGPILHEYYGGTEQNGSTYCTSEEWLKHPGTVGHPTTGCTVHIVGLDGNELPTGSIGTVYFEGRVQFEYHNDQDATSASRHPSGWSTLGDIGYLDDDGYLYLTDRKANMIISGGVNIYPQEAENTLIMHPAVTDVAVFGVPNEEFGEEVKAVVQPASMPADEAAARALEAELIEYCRANLAHYKCPRTVDFRAELPRHATGKLYKRLLKDEYWAKAGRSV